MAAGANLGEKLFGMVKTIGPVFQSYAPGLGLLDLAVGVAGAVILYFVAVSYTHLRAGKIPYFTIETPWTRNVSPERFLLENRRFSQAKSREKHPKNAPIA